MRVLDCTTLQLVGSVDTYLPSQSTYDKFCPFNSVSQSCANLFSTIVLYEGDFLVYVFYVVEYFLIYFIRLKI